MRELKILEGRLVFGICFASTCVLYYCVREDVTTLFLLEWAKLVIYSNYFTTIYYLGTTLGSIIDYIFAESNSLYSFSKFGVRILPLFIASSISSLLQNFPPSSSAEGLIVPS